MQRKHDGLGGINKLRYQFIKGLPTRIAAIRACLDTSRGIAECGCEGFGRAVRILELADLLDVEQLRACRRNFQKAQQQYVQTGDIQGLHQLLEEISHLSSSIEPASESPDWQDLPCFTAEATFGSCDIHLVMEYQYDQYLDQYFSSKGCKVRIHRKPQDLHEHLQRRDMHVVVLDDAFCLQDKKDVCKLMDECRADNISYIVFSKEADFEKRLLFARHNAKLICDAVLDEQKIKQAIEKEVALKNRRSNSILLVSDDADMLESMRFLLIKMGLRVELCSKPSEELISSLQRNHFDLVFIDYYLESLYGHELSRILKQFDEFSWLPVVYLYPRLELSCDVHAVTMQDVTHVLDVFEPQLLSESILDIFYKSNAGHRVGRYVDETRRENESRRRVLDAHSIVSVADASGNIIDVNQKFCEASGYSRDELIGKNHRIINSGVHPKSFFRNMWETITSGRIWHGEICNRRKDGELYWVKSTIMPILDDKGVPYQFISARTEVTLIKKMEHDLRISEDRLMRSQSFANIGTWDWDIQQGSLYWSPKIGPLFGYREGDLETSYENFLNAVHPDDRDALKEAVRLCLSGEKEYEIEHRAVWPDGTVKWLLERGDVVRDRDGVPLHMLGVVMDITEKKQAELALKESEERLKEAQHKGKMGHWTWLRETGEIIWSDEIYRIYGKDPESFVPDHTRCSQLLHQDDRHLLQEAESRLVQDGGDLSLDCRIVLDDGSIRWVHVEGAEKGIKEGDSGKAGYVFGTIQDITERKIAEQESKKQQRLIDVLRNGLDKYIQDNNITKAADYMLAGLLEITQSQFGIVGEILHDENQNPYMKAHAITNIAWDQKTMDFYIQNFKDGMEFRNLNNLIGSALKTGEMVISNDPSNDPRSGGLPEGHPSISSFLAKPVYHGKSPVAMYCLANKSGGYDESIVEFLKPFSVTYGSIVKAARMAEMQKQTLTELELSRREAINASRAKSQFLSSMSHELRTPLNAILGFSQLLEMNMEQNLSPQQLDSVSEIKKAGEHLLSLINEILDLTRIEAGKIDLEIESVSVIRIIRDCMAVVGPLAIKNKVDMYFDANEEADRADMHVLANSLRLKQVMLNLLSNAIKYNRKGGKVYIDAYVSDGNRLRISVQDTGFGIADEKQVSVFESFNRLGAENTEIEGTGIGLVICKKIIELMGGRIGFQSVPGEGSCFWFELCLANEALAARSITAERRGISVKLPVSNVTDRQVIYIEDNLANIRLMENVFKQFKNIKLRSASDPYSGLEMIVEHKPDMVLLDINMPGMDGYQVLDRIKNDSELCNIPVFAISANAMPKDVENGLRHGFDQYITKPIDVSSFLGVINEKFNLK